MLLRTRRFTSSITTHHAAVTDLTSVRTVVTGTAIINNNNVVFETIRNARDISSATRGPIKNGKIYRMGCVSKASNGDVDKANDFGIKTWIDLRSPAELADDKFLHSRIYKDYEGLRYDKKQDTFVPFIAEETEIKESAKKRYMLMLYAHSHTYSHTHKHTLNTFTHSLTLSTYSSIPTTYTHNRYFVSLMNESLIKRAIFFRLRKRTRAQVVCLFGLSFMSRRANKKMRSIFLDKINLGGLPLLSEIVMDYSAVEIVAVMKVLADSKSHPVALFCTAGKDRTGIIVMLCLHVLGATDEEIIADYILSDAAYKDINDKKAMVSEENTYFNIPHKSQIDPVFFNFCILCIIHSFF